MPVRNLSFPLHRPTPLVYRHHLFPRVARTRQARLHPGIFRRNFRWPESQLSEHSYRLRPLQFGLRKQLLIRRPHRGHCFSVHLPHSHILRQRRQRHSRRQRLVHLRAIRFRLRLRFLTLPHPLFPFFRPHFRSPVRELLIHSRPPKPLHRFHRPVERSFRRHLIPQHQTQTLELLFGPIVCIRLRHAPLYRQTIPLRSLQ